MKKSSGLRLVTYTIYIILIIGICFEGVTLAKQIRFLARQTDVHSCKINIEGNIRKPGWYVVPEGTTQFEILKVAGVRPTSDLSLLNLTTQVANNQSIKIGTLDKPVAINDKGQSARVENFFGEVNITNQEGYTNAIKKSLYIISGDKIQTQSSSQVEISLGSFSRVDIDNFADVTFDKINQNENGKSVTEITQNSGSCWHRIVYSNNDELYRIYTRSVVMTIGGSGADFLLEVQNDQIVVNIMDGLLLVERRTGRESTNMISGQSAIIYDDERPFQITRLAPDMSAGEQFAGLTDAKSMEMAQNSSMKFFFCVTPGIYYLVNMQYQKSEVHLIRIPEELLISQFAQNVTSINQAFLYGGPVFVTTFLERIFNTRIQKYISCTRDDFVRIIGILGGVAINVDEKTSSFTGLPKGKQRVSNNMIAKYLSPAVSGITDARDRQSQVIKTFYEELRSKNIALTLITAEQIINSAESNFSASEIIEQLEKFTSKSGLVYKEDVFPVNIIMKNGKIYYDPVLEECRRMVNIGEE